MHSGPRIWRGPHLLYCIANRELPETLKKGKDVIKMTFDLKIISKLAFKGFALIRRPAGKLAEACSHGPIDWGSRPRWGWGSEIEGHGKRKR